MGPQPAARTAELTNPVMRTFQSVLSQPGIMSFGADTPETIEEGLRRLAAAVADLSVPAGVPR